MRIEDWSELREAKNRLKSRTEEICSKIVATAEVDFHDEFVDWIVKNEFANDHIEALKKAAKKNTEYVLAALECLFANSDTTSHKQYQRFIRNITGNRRRFNDIIPGEVYRDRYPNYFYISGCDLLSDFVSLFTNLHNQLRQSEHQRLFALIKAFYKQINAVSREKGIAFVTDKNFLCFRDKTGEHVFRLLPLEALEAEGKKNLEILQKMQSAADDIYAEYRNSEHEKLFLLAGNTNIDQWLLAEVQRSFVKNPETALMPFWILYQAIFNHHDDILEIPEVNSFHETLKQRILKSYDLILDAQSGFISQTFHSNDDIKWVAQQLKIGDGTILRECYLPWLWQDKTKWIALMSRLFSHSRQDILSKMVEFLKHERGELQLFNALVEYDKNDFDFINVLEFGLKQELFSSFKQHVRRNSAEILSRIVQYFQENFENDIRARRYNPTASQRSIDRRLVRFVDMIQLLDDILGKDVTIPAEVSFEAFDQELATQLAQRLSQMPTPLGDQLLSLLPESNITLRSDDQQKSTSPTTSSGTLQLNTKAADAPISLSSSVSQRAPVSQSSQPAAIRLPARSQQPAVSTAPASHFASVATNAAPQRPQPTSVAAPEPTLFKARPAAPRAQAVVSGPIPSDVKEEKSYYKMWKKKRTAVQNVYKLARDYVKKPGHLGRHHKSKMEQLYRYCDYSTRTTTEVLAKVNQMLSEFHQELDRGTKGYTKNGSYHKRLSFMQSHLRQEVSQDALEHTNASMMAQA